MRGFRRLHFVGPCVTVFGSARFGETTRYYALARETGRSLAGAGFTVMTGGGPGIMEAANRGAREGGGFSIGCNIVLPQEQKPNPYLDLMRRVPALLRAQGDAGQVLATRSSSLPGGFGTLDEIFETLTLIQTDKIEDFPVILMGVDYWQPLLDWLRAKMVAEKTIGVEDLRALAGDRFGGGGSELDRGTDQGERRAGDVAWRRRRRRCSARAVPGGRPDARTSAVAAPLVAATGAAQGRCRSQPQRDAAAGIDFAPGARAARDMIERPGRGRHHEPARQRGARGGDRQEAARRGGHSLLGSPSSRPGARTWSRASPATARRSRSCCWRTSTWSAPRARTGSTDPKKVTEVDGYLVGRGVADDFGMAALEIETLVLLKQSGVKLARDVIVAWTGDEESGGAGIRWLFEQRARADRRRARAQRGRRHPARRAGPAEAGAAPDRREAVPGLHHHRARHRPGTRRCRRPTTRSTRSRRGCRASARTPSRRACCR